MSTSMTKPLDKEHFWQIIDNARETAGNWQRMLEPSCGETVSGETQNQIKKPKKIGPEL